MSYENNIRTLVLVYELGNMPAADRDFQISPAVISTRVCQLDEHLGVRLFQRTTRHLTATEQNISFYHGVMNILDSINLAEAQITDMTENLKGSLYLAATLGVGRRLLAPKVPDFLA